MVDIAELQCNLPRDSDSGEMELFTTHVEEAIRAGKLREANYMFSAGFRHTSLEDLLVSLDGIIHALDVVLRNGGHADLFDVAELLLSFMAACVELLTLSPNLLLSEADEAVDFCVQLVRRIVDRIEQIGDERPKRLEQRAMLAKVDMLLARRALSGPEQDTDILDVWSNVSQHFDEHDHSLFLEKCWRLLPVEGPSRTLHVLSKHLLRTVTLTGNVTEACALLNNVAKRLFERKTNGDSRNSFFFLMKLLQDRMSDGGEMKTFKVPRINTEMMLSLEAVIGSTDFYGTLGGSSIQSRSYASVLPERPDATSLATNFGLVPELQSSVAARAVEGIYSPDVNSHRQGSMPSIEMRGFKDQGYEDESFDPMRMQEDKIRRGALIEWQNDSTGNESEAQQRTRSIHASDHRSQDRSHFKATGKQPLAPSVEEVEDEALHVDHGNVPDHSYRHGQDTIDADLSTLDLSVADGVEAQKSWRTADEDASQSTLGFEQQNHSKSDSRGRTRASKFQHRTEVLPAKRPRRTERKNVAFERTANDFDEEDGRRRVPSRPKSVPGGNSRQAKSTDGSHYRFPELGDDRDTKRRIDYGDMMVVDRRSRALRKKRSNSEEDRFFEDEQSAQDFGSDTAEDIERGRKASAKILARRLRSRRTDANSRTAHVIHDPAVQHQAQGFRKSRMAGSLSMPVTDTLAEGMDPEDTFSRPQLPSRNTGEAPYNRPIDASHPLGTQRPSEQGERLFTNTNEDSSRLDHERFEEAEPPKHEDTRRSRRSTTHKVSYPYYVTYNYYGQERPVEPYIYDRYHQSQYYPSYYQPAHNPYHSSYVPDPYYASSYGTTGASTKHTRNRTWEWGLDSPRPPKNWSSRKALQEGSYNPLYTVADYTQGRAERGLSGQPDMSSNKQDRDVRSRNHNASKGPTIMAAPIQDRGYGMESDKGRPSNKLRDPDRHDAGDSLLKSSEKDQENALLYQQSISGPSRGRPDYVLHSNPQSYSARK